jgi:very-short-patch-repair endonuclease
MAKRWTDKDLKAVQERGMTVEEQIKKNTDAVMSQLKKPAPIKIEKVSIEKNTIEFILKAFQQQGLIPEYVKEHQFDLQRKFRFDYAVPELKLAIEYEGLMSDKSGHTTIAGYSKDCSKYNLATAQGWKVLRYTALNYSDLAQDIELFLRNL